MELFLNVLWVAIAAAGLCVWRIRWADQPREREHAPWRQWSAFVCALVLLFFMVSLTDDLHSELIVFEECSAGRRNAACLVCPHHAPQAHAVGNLYATLDALVDTYALPAIDFIATDREVPGAFFQPGLTPGRAPPQAFL